MLNRLSSPWAPLALAAALAAPLAAQAGSAGGLPPVGSYQFTATCGAGAACTVGTSVSASLVYTGTFASSSVTLGGSFNLTNADSGPNFGTITGLFANPVPPSASFGSQNLNLGVASGNGSNSVGFNFVTGMGSNGQWFLMDYVTSNTIASGTGGSWSAVASIPEPAEWALMLGGLGVVALVVRRRAGSAAA